MRRLTSLLILGLFLGTFLVVQAQEKPDGTVDSGGDTELEIGAETDGNDPWIDLSTPQSAYRSFVISMQRASADRPEAIDNAVRCLDVQWIEDEKDAEARARQLAAELFEVLASLDLVVEDVPDVTERSSLAVWESVGADPSAEVLSVSLVRTDQEWRFDRRTLERLDEIRDAIEAERIEEKGDEEQVRSALRSPRATMKTFLEAMDSDPPDVDSAADCLEPPEDASPGWEVLRQDHAYRLYSVLLRVRAPVLSDLPEHPKGQRHTWHVHESGRIVLRQMSDDDPDVGVWRGEWRFSRGTQASLENLYQVHASDPVLPEVVELGYTERSSLGLIVERSMPRALRTNALGLAIWKWFGILGIVLSAAIAFGLAELGARRLYARVERAWHVEAGPEAAQRLCRAVGWLVIAYGVYRAISTNALLLPAGILSFTYPLSRAMVLVATALLGLRFVQITEAHYKNSTREARLRVAGLLLPLLESFFRLFIAAILIAFVLRLLGFTQAAVLGAIGLLGAAVGFAAQGTLANVVAAMSIVYDRPFRVGDWVNLDGQDATVERLGLVSVRLRTFYNSLVIVPNSQIVTKSVDNYGERRYRRLRHFLRLRYDTPAAKIDALCEGLRELVRLHPYTRKDYYHIYLNELTPSSADVLVYIFFEVPDWATELRERHRFLLDALGLVEELGIQLAYPTQRLLVEESKDEGRLEGEDVRFPQAAGWEGVRRAKKVFIKTYGDPPKERGPVVIEEGPLTAGFDDDGGGGSDGD